MKDNPVSEDSYIIATSGSIDERHRVIKHANTFAVFDVHGDICRNNSDPHGLYCQGTRFLSLYAMSIEGKKPLLLSSDVTRDNHLVVVDLTNPDLIINTDTFVPRGTLHIFRSKFLWEGRCYGKYRIKNYGLSPISFNLEFAFGADFTDIFQVRGIERKNRGNMQFPYFTEKMLQFSYRGLDDIVRRTRIDFLLRPDHIHSDGSLYMLTLDVNQEIEFEIIVSCLGENAKEQLTTSYLKAYLDSSVFLKAGQRECTIDTSNEHLNSLIERSTSDLRMLLTDEGGNLYPYAGIPWYATPFGRDGLITSFETLWMNPEISRGVLSYLAEEQSSSFNDEQDAEPGKILHEVRVGEMANCGELPFSKYYGSADATPLFVMLAGKYLRRTGDLQFLIKLWPHIERALVWMNEHGDPDKDGFIEYQKRSKKGLDNQGWKDSGDSIFHEDGSLAGPPIALCEIQGYVYAAKKEAGFIANNLGYQEKSAELDAEAEEIRKRFEGLFWDSDMKGYIIALDGKKKSCRIKGSNMGHCLFSEIISGDRAAKTAELLMDSDFFGGWGIRTLAKDQPRYNPMSYHNGSVWPHDNAIIAEGFSNYGLNHHAAAIFDALFHVSEFLDLNRFPELFCGFDRREHQGPTLYPVACSPQAWAAASLFLLLKACLGLRVNALEKTVVFRNPCLPQWLESVHITNLEINGKSTEFIAKQRRNDVSIEVLERPGDIRILIEKGVTI